MEQRGWVDTPSTCGLTLIDQNNFKYASLRVSANIIVSQNFRNASLKY